MGAIGLISIPLRFSFSNQRKAIIDNADDKLRPTDDDYVTMNGVRQPNSVITNSGSNPTM